MTQGLLWRDELIAKDHQRRWKFHNMPIISTATAQITDEYRSSPVPPIRPLQWVDRLAGSSLTRNGNSVMFLSGERHRFAGKISNCISRDVEFGSDAVNHRGCASRRCCYPPVLQRRERDIIICSSGTCDATFGFTEFFSAVSLRMFGYRWRTGDR